MKILEFILLTFFFGLSAFCESCTVRTSKPSSNSTILPKEKIDKYMNNWMEENKKVFDWVHAPDEILYNAVMQSDSLLGICYKLTPDGPPIPSGKERVNGAIPDEWKVKGREIMQYVLEKEQKYRQQPNLTLRDILPYGASDKGTCFYIKISDPTIIEELRKDKTIKSVEAIYEPASWHGG